VKPKSADDYVGQYTLVPIR